MGTVQPIGPNQEGGCLLQILGRPFLLEICSLFSNLCCVPSIDWPAPSVWSLFHVCLVSLAGLWAPGGQGQLLIHLCIPGAPGIAGDTGGRMNSGLRSSVWL